MTKSLQSLNHDHTLALWTERISACRSSSLSVVQWCKENNICVQTYYRWQRKLFRMTRAQQEVQFVEVTPEPAAVSAPISASVQIGAIRADIYSGADAATVELVLRVLQSC